MGAMQQLIDEGKIRYVGLSEVDADVLKRAHLSFRRQIGCRSNRILHCKSRQRKGSIARLPRARGRFCRL